MLSSLPPRHQKASQLLGVNVRKISVLMNNCYICSVQLGELLDSLQLEYLSQNVLHLAAEGDAQKKCMTLRY